MVRSSSLLCKSYLAFMYHVVIFDDDIFIIQYQRKWHVFLDSFNYFRGHQSLWISDNSSCWYLISWKQYSVNTWICWSIAFFTWHNHENWHLIRVNEPTNLRNLEHFSFTRVCPYRVVFCLSFKNVKNSKTK